MLSVITERGEVIPKKESDTARFLVKRELERKHLPMLPELVEEQFFMRGRTAWNFKCSDLRVGHLKGFWIITFNVYALLKNNFMVLSSNIVLVLT